MTGLPETALVLFFGGQDSATCLAWTLERFAGVETLGFNYGQRHPSSWPAVKICLMA
jgi:7-cyano-7-deazaguanine synthase